MSRTVGCTSQSMAVRAPVMAFSSLVGLDVRRRGDLGPAEHFSPHPGLEFLRRIAGGRDTEMAHPVRKLRRIHPRATIGGQFVEHRRGYANGRNQRIESDDVEARIGLGDGRDLWRVAETLAAGARDQFELAGIDVALGRVPDVEHQRHPPGDQVGQGGRAAVVIDMGHLDAARCLSISPARWPTPRGPGEVKLSGGALLLATATNSGMVLAGNGLLATSATGWVATMLTGAKSLSVSYGSFCPMAGLISKELVATSIV